MAMETLLFRLVIVAITIRTFPILILVPSTGWIWTRRNIILLKLTSLLAFLPTTLLISTTTLLISTLLSTLISAKVSFVPFSDSLQHRIDLVSCVQATLSLWSLLNLCPAPNKRNLALPTSGCRRLAL